MFYAYFGAPCVFRPRREFLPAFPVGHRRCGNCLALALGLPNELESILYQIDLESSLEAPEWELSIYSSATKRFLKE